jgi:hypothetical protein
VVADVVQVFNDAMAPGVASRLKASVPVNKISPTPSRKHAGTWRYQIKSEAKDFSDIPLFFVYDLPLRGLWVLSLTQ